MGLGKHDADCAGYHSFRQCDTAIPFGSFLVYAVEPWGWFWVGCHPGEDPADYTDPEHRQPVGPFTSSREALLDALECGK